MDRAFVTCVITSYKREKRIVKRALDSILDQTYQDFDIIIVDDNRGEGSEILSSSLLELKECDDRIQVIKTEGGHGAQHARNTGIRHSTGKYVAFLDDDDEWMKEKLMKQVRALEEKTDCGMCYTDGYRVFDNAPGKRELKYGDTFNEGLTFRELLHEDRIGTTSQALIRRTVFDKVGMFDTDMPARQDYEMWLRISREYPICGINEGLYLYHLNSDEGKITRDWRKNVRAHLLLSGKYRDDIRGDRDAEFNVLFHIAHYYRLGAKKEKDKKLEYLGKSFIYYIRSFFSSPSYFYKQAGYKIDMIRKKRK